MNSKEIHTRHRLGEDGSDLCIGPAFEFRWEFYIRTVRVARISQVLAQPATSDGGRAARPSRVSGVIPPLNILLGNWWPHHIKRYPIDDLLGTE